VLIKAGHKGCLVVQHNDRRWQVLASRDTPSPDNSQDRTKQGQIKQDYLNKGRIKQGQIKKGQMKKSQGSDGMTKGREVAEATPQITVAQTASRDTLLPTYRVQLASFRTERGAAKGQAILKKLLGDQTVNLDILVRRSRRKGPAAFDYRIRTGPITSRTEGTGLCETLKKAGHLGCLVVEHNELLWNNLAGQPVERNKASLGGPQARTRDVASIAADLAPTIIELPSPDVMEPDHISSTGSAGMAKEPATPMVTPMVDI
jgi:hypothetical protein